MNSFGSSQRASRTAAPAEHRRWHPTAGKPIPGARRDWDVRKLSRGLALGIFAEWVNVGFDDKGLLTTLLARFPTAARQSVPLADYVQLRIAEAVVAMRKESLTEALEHLNCVLALERDIADPSVIIVAGLWKARCMRHPGEYEQAMAVTKHFMQLAESLGLVASPPSCAPLKAGFSSKEAD